MREMDLVPVLLGAVAGTSTADVEVLTGTGCGNNCCDAATDYAKCEDELPQLSDEC